MTGTMWPAELLVVDDEPLARAVLSELLQTETGITISEARNGADAVEAIRTKHPDLVLLDVQMPTLDGFDVIAEIGEDNMPPVIFVTAFDRHAVRAFEVHALDYLLKPVDPDRLRDAIEHARQLHARTAASPVNEMLRAAVRMIRNAESEPGHNVADDRIAVRDGGRIWFVRPEEILWLESQGNYVTLNLGKGTLRHRATVDQMAEQLVSSFLRIRRSTLVRAQAVRACEPEGKGSYSVILENGTRLLSSRFFRHHLAPLLDR